MADKPHSQAVLSVLANRLQGAQQESIDTPFGVKLHCCVGRYALGQSVQAPGVDDCSPREQAEVLACGTRSDHGGTWYLLRFTAPHRGSALVEEADLREDWQPPPLQRPSLPPQSPLHSPMAMPGRGSLATFTVGKAREARPHRA